jgi:hypothetical protein
MQCLRGSRVGHVQDTARAHVRNEVVVESPYLGRVVTNPWVENGERLKLLEIAHVFRKPGF